MGLWHCLIGLLALLAVAAALFGLDRLGRWLEDRGWLYYRRKRPSSSPLGAWVALQQFIEPTVRHVYEVGQEYREEDAEARRDGLLATLLDCLDATPIHPEAVRVCLTLARRGGLDWKALYEEAVRGQQAARPERAELLPRVEDVAPPD
jgi:hypothetical protein